MPERLTVMLSGTLRFGRRSQATGTVIQALLMLLCSLVMTYLARLALQTEGLKN